MAPNFHDNTSSIFTSRHLVGLTTRTIWRIPYHEVLYAGSEFSRKNYKLTTRFENKCMNDEDYDRILVAWNSFAARMTNIWLCSNCKLKFWTLTSNDKNENELYYKGSGVCRVKFLINCCFVSKFCQTPAITTISMKESFHIWSWKWQMKAEKLPNLNPSSIVVFFFPFHYL